ncbi:GATA transcription factor [Heracleum sosnowskyi]|uniref:GATA transcription factor n=1 Tax=Heracleum sosnowskyi TaxID=360622 RepID=A0AAD8MH02_9APIA|nr:GATA transcription factor [Heracleum sosnowskyi]
METSPDFYQASPAAYYNKIQHEKRQSDTKPAGEHFIIEDLLDFPNDDVILTDATFDHVTGTSTDSSAVTLVDTCNSANFAAHSQFSNDLCVPYDDMAELEWLSNFVEESFSSEDLQKLQLISGMKATTDASENRTQNNRDNPIFRPQVSVPGKARSKRSRAAPCNWTSRLLVLPPTSTPAMSSESSESEIVASSGKKMGKGLIMGKKKDVSDNGGGSMSGGDGRKCLHCMTDKTPQWRTGPMGPKTLCNACGVRYKSGRLVPEYRPAASPTFVLAKHSNSHRKVLELRRQKEMQRAQHDQQQFIHQGMMFDVSTSEDFLIHQHIGPDYRQLL